MGGGNFGGGEVAHFVAFFRILAVRGGRMMPGATVMRRRRSRPFPHPTPLIAPRAMMNLLRHFGGQGTGLGVVMLTAPVQVRHKFIYSAQGGCARAIELEKRLTRVGLRKLGRCRRAYV